MSAAMTFEWAKLRTLRSTWWCLGVAAFLQVAYALLLGLDARTDLEQSGGPSDLAVGDAGLLSVQFAQYALIAAALLAVTGEYSTGTIGVTLRAVPVRGRMLVAKAAVVGGAAAAAGIGLMLVAALVGGLTAGSYAQWDVPGFLGDAAIVAGYAAALAVFALGLGSAVRSAVGGLTIVVVVAVVLPTVLTRIHLGAIESLNDYLPGSAGTAVLYGALSDPEAGMPYGAGTGLLVFGAWAAAARWGDDDERGTLNHVTDEVRRAAARAVRSGRSVSCAWEVTDELERSTTSCPVAADMPGSENLPAAFHRDRRWGFSSEKIGLTFHGNTLTHLDAPCHLYWDGRMYNGRSSDLVGADTGSGWAAVTAAADGIVTRGVLLDVAAVRGELAPGQGAFPEDLEEAERRQGVRVRSGDAVLLRTGAGRRRHGNGVTGGLAQAGWHASCLPWLHQREVALIGADTPQDVQPSGYDDVLMPVHAVGRQELPRGQRVLPAGADRTAGVRRRLRVHPRAGRVRGRPGGPVSPHSSVSPASWASSAACTRFRTPSRVRIVLTYALTVPSTRNRRRAMPAFE